MPRERAVGREVYAPIVGALKSMLIIGICLEAKFMVESHRIITVHKLDFA
jgi:hypothetical protein